MNIQNQSNKNSQYFEQNKPVFKSAAILNASGNLMQSIENGGFLASFLIQDGFGMTLPRSVAGFLRDKEVTGHYNMQEGFEVVGREGLTGPSMMAVAPLMLLLTAKFGKTTSVNSQLINRFGNSLKELVSKPDFDKTLLKDAERFKTEFYKTNIEKMLTETLGKENTSKESVEYIMKQIANYEKIPENAVLKKFRGKAKYRKGCIDNIAEHINDLKYSTGKDLNMLGKLRFGSGINKDFKNFSTKNAIEGMIKYSNDAITANKHLEKLDALRAENIKNQAVAKRIITTIATMAATLGVLSVLPKIYARSETAPGARKKQPENLGGKQNQSVNFKGKGDADFLSRLGKKFSHNKKYDELASELEYNGHNFTNSLMAGLSIFGLLIPRGLHAYNRAQVNEDGKKDLTELWEIIMRDLTSSLAVVFAVPMGTRACVTAYEKNSGFVLMQKDRNMSKSKTILDLFNPYSKAHVLTNAEISNLYNKVDTKAKMLNFCRYIDDNGGDLQKILSKSENAESVFNKSTMDLSSLKGLSKKDKNKKIIEFFEKNNLLDNTIKTLMQGTGRPGTNKIAAFARGLNSVPGLLTTFFISPYILGWLIPRLTYANTRRIHAKQDEEHAQQLRASA